MKKIMALLLTLSMIITLSFGNLSFAYSNMDTVIMQNKDGEKALSTYVYSDLESFEKNVTLLAKNALNTKKENSPEKIEAFKKDVDFVIGEVNYLLSKISQDYDIYKDDSEVGNGLLAVGLIAYTYRIALNQLKTYVDVKTVEEEYRSLDSYFKSIESAERNTNILKEYIPKY